MRCRDFRDRAELLRDDALPAAEAAEARAHAGGCGECRAFEAEAAALLAPLGGFPPGPYLPPGPGGGFPPPWAAGSGTALGVVAAFLVLGGAAALGLLGAGAPPSGPGDTEAAPVEAASAPPAEEVGTPTPAVPPAAEGIGGLPPGAYAGRIVDEEGAPVAGAAVEVDGAPPAVSDGDGIFRIDGLPAGGSRTLRIRAPGAVPFAALAPPLRPGVVTLLAAIPAGPPREVRVLVRGPGGAPAAGARVRAAFVAGSLHPDSFPSYEEGPGADAPPWGEERDTDGAGIARFEGLGPGTWTFSAGAPGFAASRPVEGRAVAGPGGPAAVLLLEPAATVEGVVVDATGRPLPRAEVAWVRACDRRFAGDVRHEGRGRAGPDGAFRLEGLPAAPVHLRVRAPGASVWCGAGSVDPPVTPRVFVEAPPLRTVSGLVVDEEGRPVPGIVLLASATIPRLSHAGSEPIVARTGPDGRFAVEGVPALSGVTLGPLRGGAWTRSPEAFPGTIGPEGWGAPLAPFRLAVRRAGSVEGTVLDREGRPCAGMEVSACGGTAFGPSHLVALGTSRTDGSGSFRLDGLPPGTVRLVARPARAQDGTDLSSAVVVEASGPASGETPAIEIAPGSAVRATLRAREGAAPGAPDPSLPIRGTVRTADGAPVGGARVFAMVGDGRIPAFLRRLPFVPAIHAAADGTFEGTFDPPFRAPAGVAIPCLLVATAPDGRAGTAEIAVRPDGPVAEATVVLTEAHRLEGRVLGPDGAPVAGALLDACGVEEGPGMGFVLPRAATAADGSFVLPGLPPGATDLLVAVPGRAPIRVPATGAADGPLVVRLPALGVIRGTVRLADGTPLAGLPVRWHSPAAPESPRRTLTAPDGGFSFPDLPLVPFRIDAGAADPEEDAGAAVQGSAPFPAGTVEAPVLLHPGAAVEGTVEDSGGRPVAGARVVATFSHGGLRRARRARADGRGRFEVTGLPRGAEATLQVEEGGHSVEVRAAPGGAPAAIRLPGAVEAAEATALVGGVLLDGAGAPLPRTPVRLLAPSGTCIDAAPSDLRGRFSLRAFPGGTFTLEVRREDGACRYADRVEAGTTEEVLRMDGPPGLLRGRVLDEDGSPAPGAWVTAFRLGDPSPGRFLLEEPHPLSPGMPGTRRTRAGADGSFDLGSPAGRWAILAGQAGTRSVPLAALPWDAAAPSIPEVRIGPAWTLRLRAEGAARAEVAFPALLPSDAPLPVLRRVVPPSGVLVFPGLPAGAVEVTTFGADGREIARRRVEGAPGDGVDAELTPR